jgi:hypothetical protein
MKLKLGGVGVAGSSPDGEVSLVRVVDRCLLRTLNPSGFISWD